MSLVSFFVVLKQNRGDNVKPDVCLVTERGMSQQKQQLLLFLLFPAVVLGEEFGEPLRCQ